MPEILPKTMADRGAFWTPVPDWTSATLAGEGWRALSVHGLHRVLISGNLDAGLADIAPGAPSIGLWQVANGDIHALRIGRDRMLITSTTPLASAAGWNAAGFAASIVDDAYATIEISGAGLRDLVAEMTFADLDVNSPSTATLVCGTPGLLHRVAADCVRLHVEAPLATYVWHWLERR